MKNGPEGPSWCIKDACIGGDEVPNVFSKYAVHSLI